MLRKCYLDFLFRIFIITQAVGGGCVVLDALGRSPGITVIILFVAVVIWFVARVGRICRFVTRILWFVGWLRVSRLWVLAMILRIGRCFSLSLWLRLGLRLGIRVSKHCDYSETKQ